MHRIAQTELTEPDMKSTLHMQYRGPRVTNFRQFRCTISRLEDI